MQNYINWINENPVEIYADYRDELSQEMAQMIIDGEFDKFWESAWESEFQITDYPEFWDYWESEFASEFGFDSWDDVPDDIKEICYENRLYNSRDYWRDVCRNTRLNIVARLIKNNGEFIIFPMEGIYSDHEDNKARKQYLKRHCGIDLYNGRFAECYYDDTILVALGQVDLWAILESNKKPEKIWIDSDTMTIGFDSWNGSGTCSNDQYKGNRRKMRAELFVDGIRGYGVDDTYGFVGSVWSNEIEIAE